LRELRPPEEETAGPLLADLIGDPSIIGTVGKGGADAPYNLGDGDRCEMWDEPLEDEARS
jgi:hypothetical protein